MPDHLTDRAALALAAADIGELLGRTSARVVVGITGPPGTGKSTFAGRLLEIVEGGALLPMDGFHLSDRQLDRLGRRSRKGAPDTFDVEGYVTALGRAATSAGDVYVPDFDRALGEPVAASLVIAAEARVVITEGNYLALADGGWGSVRGVLDRLYYLDCSSSVRRSRLIERHVAGGRSRLDAERWVHVVDEPNAALIAHTETTCDRTFYVEAGS